MTETFRGTFPVHTSVVQKWVALDKKSDQLWTAYPAHEIERIMWDYSIIPQGSRYRTFDTKIESAIFVIPMYNKPLPKWKNYSFIKWLRKKLT